MRNPEVTKEKILKHAGVLFNTHGYKHTSIGDITKATGLTKGAIYRHFDNKEELEMEALSHLSTQMFGKLRTQIKLQATAPAKLVAIFRYFETYATKPEVEGGCPLLNVAVEADDAHPLLRKRAMTILKLLHQAVVTILENGIKYNQIKNNIDKDYYATVIIAALEGAIMMSKLQGTNHDIKLVSGHLEKLVKEIEQ